jgi:hypothetical protein
MTTLANETLGLATFSKTGLAFFITLQTAADG